MTNFINNTWLLVQYIKSKEKHGEVARTLRDLQPLSFHGKNKALYLITGLTLEHSRLEYCL